MQRHGTKAPLTPPPTPLAALGRGLRSCAGRPSGSARRPHPHRPPSSRSPMASARAAPHGERRGRGAWEEHLPRRADEGAGGAPSARPKLGLHKTEEETGNRFILSTIRQKVFDKQAREGLRGRPLWKGFRVLGPARPRPQGVEVQLERAAHGVAHGGKPSARRVRETGVRKRRKRLAEAIGGGESD